MLQRLFDALRSFGITAFRFLIAYRGTLTSSLLAVTMAYLVISQPSNQWWSAFVAGICLLALCDGTLDVFFRRPPPRPGQSVRILRPPPGEAPLWVREKWVGLELPLAYGARGPH